MPTVKEYQSENGYYIRSKIEDHFVTLQLSPEAEGLLSDLGFQNDENISWQFLKPLCDSGHAYTNKSGTEVATDTIDVEGTVSSSGLNPEDQQRLEAFIAEHEPEEIEGESERHPEKNDQESADPPEIDASARGRIEKWSPTDEEYEATLNRIARTDHVDGVLKSMAHHGTNHPMSVDRFQVSSQGIPTYSFETTGVVWTVHDYRTVRKYSTNAELFFSIRPGSKQSQSITIKSDSVEWHTVGERFTTTQIDDLVTVGPDILYYSRQLTKSPDIDPQNIIDGATGSISSKDANRVDELAEIHSVDPEEYSRAIGAVLTLGEKGYGRIRAHTGHTFKFTVDDVKGDSVERGDVVTFDVKHHRERIYADEIRCDDSGIPSTEIVSGWPEWNDCSPSWLRENWAKDAEENGTDTDTIVLRRSDDERGYECINVTIDLLSFYLITNTAEIAETIDDAVRTLLKDSIDGSAPAPRPPIATKEVEISLPTSLVSIIDSITNTSPNYETRGDLFNAALQQHIDQEKVDMTVRVPSGYHDAVEKLAENRGISTDEFMRTALEDFIGKELRRNTPTQ